MTFPVPGSATFMRAAADYYLNQNLASGETTIPRLGVGTGATLVSQQMQLTYWTAVRTEPANNIVGNTANVAAGATPTYCAMGVYQVDGSGNLTLAGQCANDTTLFAATFSTFTRPFITPFQKIQGQRYAFAYLVVSAAAMPNISGYNGTTAMATFAPRISGQAAGLSVLPASLLVGQVFNNPSMFFGAVTP
jgi:hypothetical protein